MKFTQSYKLLEQYFKTFITPMLACMTHKETELGIRAKK